MRDPLQMADERQLAEWAFGREGVVTDRELAEAALRELARRAELAREAQREAEEEAERAAADSAHDDTNPDDTDDDSRAARARTRRLIITLTAAIVLAAVVAIALVLAAARPVSSLVIFDREPTPAEADLTALVSQIGLGDDAEVRVLAQSETATVVALRTVALASNPSGSVCVAVVESDVVTGSSCESVDGFRDAGIAVTLVGTTGLFSIDWGPHGDPQIRLPDDFQVGPSGGRPARP